MFSTLQNSLSRMELILLCTSWAIEPINYLIRIISFGYAQLDIVSYSQCPAYTVPLKIQWFRSGPQHTKISTTQNFVCRCAIAWRLVPHEPTKGGAPVGAPANHFRQSILYASCPHSFHALPQRKGSAKHAHGFPPAYASQLRFCQWFQARPKPR